MYYNITERKRRGTGIKSKFFKIIVDLLFDLVGGVFYAVGVYTFAGGAFFAPGGVSGISLILNYLFKFPVGITVFLLNIPLILLSFKFVGWKFLLKTLKSTIFCTVLIDFVFARFPQYSGSQLLAALFSGVFIGLGMALFYMRGSSSGGTDLLTMSIKAVRPHLSLGFVTLATDVIIIMIGWPVYGSIDAVLYGLICTAATSVVIDKVLNGLGSGKLLFIVTSKGQEIADHISAKYDRGSTMFDAVGTYTGSARTIVLCACSVAEAYKIRSSANKIDKAAFIMISDASEVYGEGFSDGENIIP